jgi:uncharacterized repeat protein (TIGR02543 family)
MWSYYFNYGNITGGGVLLSVKANAAALGSITGTLSGLHPANTPVSITATPASGYSLLSWTSGGASLGAASSLSFALARDTVITANFGKAGSHDLAVAGTLKDVSGIKTVTHLTLTGAVDARDVKFMRDSMPFLMELDLSGSAVVAYSGEEGTSPWDNSSYPANEMPQHSFYNNSNNAGKTSLIALKLPAGLTSIGGNAFSDCSNLTGTLTLPAGLTSIGDNAFSNCSNLSGTLTLPAGLTSIGYYAFANCSGLSGSLTLPTGLTSIESGTFNNCSGLSGNLTLPAGLTSIGYNAFYNCNGFTSVTNLSLTPQNINYSTFSNTGSITLTVPTSSLSLYKNANGWSDFNNNDITGGGVLLSVKINNAALGSVTGTLSGLYSANASVELAANPASGYSFFGWTSGGASLGTASLLSFVLQKDTAITANFGKVSTYNLAAAGTLKNISGIETVSHLTLTGVIDARDVKFMRDNMPVLTELDLSGATVTAYSGEDGTTFGSYSYPANEMPQYSFYNGSNGTAKTSLTEVKLPAGLTSIGRSAFYNCRNLTGNLALPTELTSIGSAAFYNCSKLTGTLTLPAGLTSIGNSAFYSCSGLSGSLTLPARLTSIGSAAFYSCSGLSGSLTLPAGVTSIGNSAFYSCSGLSGSLTLPAGLTNIGSAAFYNCSGLSGSLTLPAGVTSIGDQAFYSCTGFTSVTNLNLTPQSIGYVFQGVTIGNITLTVPTSAATLYGNANVWKDFGSVSNGGVLLSVKANNAALGSVSGTVSGLHPDNTSVVLTATPASGYSFFGWTSGGASLGTASLLSFTLTKDTVITANFGKVSTHNLTAAGTLKNISGIETVSHLTLTGVIDARDVKFMRDNMPVLTELDLSGAVVTAYSGEDGTIFESYSYPANEMPPYSFYNSSNGTAKASLAAVKLPAGLTSIGSAAFANCSGLSGNLTLPTGLTSIGNSAFSNCSGLSGNLTLPIGLTNIGGEAFYNCSGLSGSLTIPDGLTFISYYTFYGCSGLSSLTLPAGLASISNLAFYSCSGLTSITNLNPVPQSIYDDVFYNANVNSVALRVPAASLADYQNAQVWRNFYSIIGGATLRTTVNNSAWGSVTGADNGWLPDSATVTLTAASAQGYEFGSWTSGSATLGASTSISFTLTQDTVITANFKPLGNVAIYTVTFNINGGGSSVDPLTVASGDRVTKPANPTRSGYTFAGWYSNAELTGSAWNFETGTVTANTTLYAKWAEVTYTVTFEVNGGSRITPQTVAQGDTVVKPADPTRSGYTFAGWYQNSTLTSAWSFAYDVAADITLYARWTPVTCTVTFNATGGSGIGQQQVTPGSTIVEPAKPARSGYVFIGWYKDAALAGVWNFASDVVTASLTLYAKWADENATIYTVTFNADGGSAVSPQQVESGGKVAQVTPPTRAGYTFGGWYSDAALTSLWDVNTAVTGNMTLYARWSSNQPSTDVESHTLGVVKVYPNPTSGMVTVESDGAEVRLYSLQGTLLKRTSGNNLNLSGYPSGVYVLKAGSKTARIVKQ